MTLFPTIPTDGTAIRWQQTDDPEELPYDVVAIVWDGDLCYGDPSGWIEIPWTQFLADVTDYGYINVQTATAWEEITTWRS